jgi:3',5'-cyclic AMP phosphodiesterase CpdA
MEAIDAYKIYLGIRNHFTLDKYDYIKYNRKVNVSYDSFLKRRDKIFFAKLGNRKDKYLEDFLVANMIHDPKVWVGELLSDECENRYKDWLRKKQSLTYLFKNEMSFIEGWNSKQINSWFGVNEGDHPNIIKKYLRGEISLETLTILNSIMEFTKRYDKEIIDPVYKEVSQLCKKYQPFLEYDRSKMKRILKDLVEQ